MDTSSSASGSLAGVAADDQRGGADRSVAPVAAGSSPRGSEGIPLQGCLSSFVRHWGWEPLPRGTEQLLKDIFQTLHSLGLQYSLHEQQGDQEDVLHQAQPQATAESQGSGGRQRVLILRISFGPPQSELEAFEAGRPPGSAGLVT